MKKLTVLLTIFLLGIGTSANAIPHDPLWVTPPTDEYTIVDRQGGWDDSPPAEGYSDAYVGYTGGTWSGYYLGTIMGVNDGDDVLTEIISYYLDDLTYTVTDPDKVDVDTISGGNTGTDGTLTIDWDSDRLSGTWSTDGSYVEFYTVKGAREFALYYLAPTLDSEDLDSGYWTTEHLSTPVNYWMQILGIDGNQPEISHLTAITASPVPEPATMLLLGTGLIGLAGVGRKKFFK